jgi:hypothetical protein
MPGTPFISKQHFMGRAKILPQFVHASNAVGDTVDPSHEPCSNCAESAEKTLRATVLAEPFPGAVAPGCVLVFAKEFSEI